MENETKIHAYAGQSIKLSSGKPYTIVMHQSRNIEIVSATSSDIVDKNLNVHISSNNEMKKHIYKEENLELTPATQLPINKKITIQIAQSDPQPMLMLYPNGNNTPIQYQIPLQSFIDTTNNDPLKVFLFNFDLSKSKRGPVLNLGNGSTSYLNGLNFTPITDENSTMVFSQELMNRINIPDGQVSIDSLSDSQCDSIVKDILGDNFEDQLDKENVEKSEGKQFWTTKKIVATSSKTSYKVYLQRHILQDFGFKGKFYIKTINGKQFIIFNGYCGLRKWYTASRYQITNPKVISLSAAGKLKTALKGTSVTLLITGSIDIIDWMLKEDNEKEFSDLCVTLGMDALKTVVGSLITAGFVAFGLMIAALFAATVPVWIVVVGTITIGIGVGFIIDLIDQKIGASEYMKSKGHEGKSLLDAAWQEYVVEPLGTMYYQLEKSIENLYYMPVGTGW